MADRIVLLVHVQASQDQQDNTIKHPETVSKVTLFTLFTLNCVQCIYYFALSGAQQFL